MAQEAGGAATPVEGPGSGAIGRTDFGQLFDQALDHVNGLQQDSKDLQTRFELGDRAVSIGDVMIASQKSSIAFDATLQVRNKLVQAYQDIMNMPV